MDIKNSRENKLIVDKVEEALQAAYSSNQEFNAVLDESRAIVIQKFAGPGA